MIDLLAISDFLTVEAALYVGLGFVAQLIDGLGMAYGVIVTTTLLALGYPPVIASASTHAAEVVTTGLAGGSHLWHGNVDRRLFLQLAPAGVLGGFVGAYLLTQVPEDPIKLFVAVYLLLMAGLIGRRAYTGQRKRDHNVPTPPIGLVGGFLDAMGGGGWGPLVTSTLMARGETPRCSIGSATLAEAFVAIVVSAIFLWQLDLGRYALVVAGLILGGAMAAPLAGWLSKTLPPRILMAVVSFVVGALAIYNLTAVGTKLFSGPS